METNCIENNINDNLIEKDLANKYSIFLSLTENDVPKIKGLYEWGAKAMEYSIKEKAIAFNLVPKRGEVWIIDLGINVGSELDKKRPCLIISENNYNKSSSKITAIPISHSSYLFDSQVNITEEYLLGVENRLDGTLKTESIKELSKSRLSRKIGVISIEGMKALEKALSFHLGLSSDYEVPELNFSV